MKRLIGLTLPLLLAACSDVPKPVIPIAAVMDEAAITARIKVRCPELDKKDLATLRQTPTRPLGDKPVDKAGVRAWVDRIEASGARKSEAGQKIAAEYERCRQGTTAVPSTGS